ncbi:ATP-binding protein [Streptomyces sp. KR80]|uniref:ATP-binding protein n=1 Tax=Streptomyces sp. KR80 TaxID=3457426 RepID=UPI003FCF7319
MRPPRPPSPEDLACSLTLPGQSHCAAIARTAVRSTLHTHGLDAFAPAAVQAASELVSAACRLTPGEDLYLSVRYRAAALRLILWDQHPHHVDPTAVATCEGRRRRALWLLAAVTEACGGDWGTAEARPPQQGTKSWALLPRSGLVAYATRR